MKKASTLIIMLLLFIQSFSQDFESLTTSEAPQMLATSYPPLLHTGVFDEVNYISDNISCVRVVKNSNKVYITWNICDDDTYSEFFITKTQGVENSLVANIKNVPCTPGFPLLYVAVDSSNTNKTAFYKMFKISQEGDIKHIVTILLPVANAELAKTKKKKKLKSDLTASVSNGYTN